MNTMNILEKARKLERVANKPRRKGVELAHEAINCLQRTYDDDQLRDRGFQIVTNWIERASNLNKPNTGSLQSPDTDPLDDRGDAWEPTALPPDPDALPIMTCGELLEKYPECRPYVIEGLLREGETMNVIAAPKVGKSFLALGLGFAVGLGQPWLGTFPTTAGKVLVIDNELHKETITHRLRKLANGHPTTPAQDAQPYPPTRIGCIGGSFQPDSACQRHNIPRIL